MDRVIALYRSFVHANLTRSHLGAQSVPSNCMDVVSLDEYAHAADLTDYFRLLLDGKGEERLVRVFVEFIQEGMAVLVVYPRSRTEIEIIRKVLEFRSPETVLWRVAPAEARSSLRSDHAAGSSL